MFFIFTNINSFHYYLQLCTDGLRAVKGTSVITGRKCNKVTSVIRFGQKCNKALDISTNLKGTCHSELMSSSVNIALVLVFYASSNALNALIN